MSNDFRKVDRTYVSNFSPLEAPPTMDQDQIPGAASFDSLFALARASFKSGDINATIEQCNATIGAYPENPQCFMLKARALVAEERFDEALEALRLGLDRNESDLKLLNMTRNIALRARGFEAAKEFADRISALAPADMRNRAFLVQYDLASGKSDFALAGAQSLAADFPGEPVGWMLTAQVQQAQRCPAEALSTIEIALRLHPANRKLLNLARYLATRLGLIGDAIEHARALHEIAPDDYHNRIFLAASIGDFEETLRCSEELIAEAPHDARGWLLKADALVARHRPGEALTVLRNAPDAVTLDPRILACARDVAFSHGRFSEALDYALQLLSLAPEDRRNERVLLRCWMATGEFDSIEDYLQRAGARADEQPLRKSRRYFREYQRLNQTTPAVVRAWRNSLENIAQPRGIPARGNNAATMIQYWSQGAPPKDVELVIAEWASLLEREEIGQLKLFDRNSAARWIDEHAPEFSGQFAKAFHYAMESDIFRVAYASKHACIYLDTDSWPLEHSGAILKFAVTSGRSMLYLRAQRPWIANGFFVSSLDCPFFAELVSQCLSLDLDKWRRNRMTVGKTFGPSRYNKVLGDLLKRSSNWKSDPIAGVPGCSRLTFDGAEIHFSHEAAVAAVKPPFILGYTATESSWKRISGK